MIKDDIKKILESNDEKKIEEMIKNFLDKNPPTDEERGRFYADRVTDAFQALMPIFETYEDIQEEFIEALRIFNAKAKILSE